MDMYSESRARIDRKNILWNLLMLFACVLLVVFATVKGAFVTREYKTTKHVLEAKLMETEALLNATRAELEDVKAELNEQNNVPTFYDPPTEEIPLHAAKLAPTVTETCEIPELATERDVELIARVMWGEATIVKSSAERAAVAWCILNRVDESGDSIEATVLAPHQFVCREGDEVPTWALELAEDVVDRWEREHAGESDVGRTLPAEYRHFIGDGWHNYFSVEWNSTDYWDWSLPDPYTEELTK